LAAQSSNDCELNQACTGWFMLSHPYVPNTRQVPKTDCDSKDQVAPTSGHLPKAGQKQ